VIYTGGTLGMVPSDPGNPASPLRPGTCEEVKGLLSAITPPPGTSVGIHWELRAIPGERPYDSSDINAEHWLRIASFIENEYPRWDGFVVIHGTDTMAYTASGLSFLFENLAKPVVLTGSQLPLVDERSDAVGNLANAIYVAGSQAARLPCVPEVTICFGHFLLRGNRARKVSTADLNGFESPNYPPLGLLRERIEINPQVVRRIPDNVAEPFYSLRQLCTDVMDITLFPGIRAEHLRALLNSPNLKGLVVRSFGAGNVMNDARVVEELDAAARRGVVILNLTQCLRGRVEMGLYESSSALLDIGVTSGSDMTPEAGLAKMMWALSTVPDAEVVQQLQVNLRGEQSTDQFEVSYHCTGGSAALPGQFRKESLERALLRLRGVRFENAGEPYELHVFLGHQSKVEALDAASVFLAATLCGRAPAEPVTLVSDVTAKLFQFAEDGCNLSITVQAASGGPFSCDGLHLALFSRASAGRS
jgi:L-asparaginase